jgi:ribonuclease D
MELDVKGLKDAALEAFSKIAGTDWHERRLNRQGYLKIKGYESLDHDKKELFKKLYLWRFRRAKEENRAVFMFLPDKNLLDLTLDAGHPEKYLSRRKLKVYGEEVERIIKNI